jgi:hypothetical protein
MSFDPRTVAQLFKLELGDMLNSWDAAKPMRTGAPHASAILASDSEWCLRRHVLLALCPEQIQRPEIKPWSAHQNAVFLNGWHLHEKYQKLFSEHGQVVEVETPHFDEVRYLWFTPDVILKFAMLPWVGEIKGYHDEHFKKLEEAGEPPEAAYKQCNLYCHLLGIEQGLVLVENKNTQDVKVWAIQRNAELARPYTQRCYDVKKGITLAREHGKLPERKCSSHKDRLAEKCSACQMCFKLK